MGISDMQKWTEEVLEANKTLIFLCFSLCINILWQSQKAILTIAEFEFVDNFYSKFQLVSTFSISSEFSVENWLLCFDISSKWVIRCNWSSSALMTVRCGERLIPRLIVAAHFTYWTKESIHQKCQQVHVVHVQFGKKCILLLNDTFFHNFFSVNPDWKYYQGITWKDDHLTSPCYDFITPSNFFEGPRHWVKPKQPLSLNSVQDSGISVSNNKWVTCSGCKRFWKSARASYIWAFLAKSRQKKPLGRFFEHLPFHLIFCLLECQHLGVCRYKIATP